MKNINFNIEEAMMASLVEIKEKRMIKSITETIRYCVSEVYSKEFPNSFLIERERSKRLNRTPKELATATAEVADDREKAKEARVRQKQVDICLQMDEATLSVHPQYGYETCSYPQFETNGPHRTTKTFVHEGLDIINAETPSLQYSDLFGKTGEIGKQNWLKQKKENDKADAKRAEKA